MRNSFTETTRQKLPEENLQMSEAVLDINAIHALMPHRYPFVLVDRVTEYRIMEYLIAIKNVTVNEPFFQGHFPGNPVMPGVLILEAFAQTSGLLAKKSLPSPEKYQFLLAGVEDARFRQVVIPGDQMILRADLIKNKQAFWYTCCAGTVGGKTVSSAKITIVAREISPC